MLCDDRAGHLDVPPQMSGATHSILKFALMKGHAPVMKCVEEAVSLDVRAQAEGVSAGSRWILTSAKSRRTAAR